MDKLREICDQTRQETARRKAQLSESTLKQHIDSLSPPRGFARALKAQVTHNKVGLIAEIKRRSPSGGLLRPDLDPASLAKLYADGGATCLSVLTDMPFFGGQAADLTAARDACNLPVLRKDFILEPWQVLETRAMGADAILLIAAVLSDDDLITLRSLAHDTGLDVLLEVHDHAELKRALALPDCPELLGINNRNLKTLVTDLAATEQLAPQIPANHPALPVCESGIRTQTDIQRMRQAGVSCFLVGESLLLQSDIRQAVQTLTA